VEVVRDGTEIEPRFFGERSIADQVEWAVFLGRESVPIRIVASCGEYGAQGGPPVE
jgi:hypothetical protein